MFQNLGMDNAGNPLSWSDIHAFAIMTMTDLEPGEAEALHRASRAYAAALQMYSGQSRPPPYGHEVKQRNKVDDMLRAAFAALSKKGR